MRVTGRMAPCIEPMGHVQSSLIHGSICALSSDVFPTSKPLQSPIGFLSVFSSPSSPPFPLSLPGTKVFYWKSGQPPPTIPTPPADPVFLSPKMVRLNGIAGADDATIRPHLPYNRGLEQQSSSNLGRWISLNVFPQFHSSLDQVSF